MMLIPTYHVETTYFEYDAEGKLVVHDHGIYDVEVAEKVENSKLSLPFRYDILFCHVLFCSDLLYFILFCS